MPEISSVSWGLGLSEEIGSGNVLPLLVAYIGGSAAALIATYYLLKVLYLGAKRVFTTWRRRLKTSTKDT